MAREYEHGTRGRYSRGCRCAQCKAAWAQYNKDLRARRSEGPIPPRVHGTVGGASNWGCKCERCTKAAADAYRAHRHPDMDEGVRKAYERGFKDGKKEVDKAAEDRGWVNCLLDIEAKKNAGQEQGLDV